MGKTIVVILPHPHMLYKFKDLMIDEMKQNEGSNYAWLQTMNKLQFRNTSIVFILGSQPEKLRGMWADEIRIVDPKGLSEDMKKQIKMQSIK